MKFGKNSVQCLILYVDEFKSLQLVLLLDLFYFVKPVNYLDAKCFLVYRCVVLLSFPLFPGNIQKLVI